MKLILISGLSGSGKSVALKVLEDDGFFCVDNLPPLLLPELAKWHETHNSSLKLAVSIDSRLGIDISRFDRLMALAQMAQIQVGILFLDTRDDVLIRRFSQTRRPHPLAKNKVTLEEAIQNEREMLGLLRENAYVVDTTHLSANQLRSIIRDWAQIEISKFTITFESFGFKYGIPLDADFVFDVRSLPNPYYDDNLRSLNGNDAEIKQFFALTDDANNLINDIAAFLKRRIQEMRQHKNHLNVSIGCTGGQHRSVFVAASLAKYFQDDYSVLLRHRQLFEREKL